MADYIKREAALQVIDYAKQLTSEQIVRESGTYELLSDTGKACYDGIITALAMCKRLINEAVIAADVQPVDRWISVNDKLPEQDENVLVFTEDKDIMTMIYKVIPFRWYKPKFGGFDKDYVTHWKPRPEPPKDGEQNDT